MKKVIAMGMMSAMLAVMPTFAQNGLKDALGKYCLIGAAINQW